MQDGYTKAPLKRKKGLMIFNSHFTMQDMYSTFSVFENLPPKKSFKTKPIMGHILIPDLTNIGANIDRQTWPEKANYF